METKVYFEKIDKKNRYDMTDFEGVCLICRLWDELSLLVGKDLAIIFGWSKKSS